MMGSYDHKGEIIHVTTYGMGTTSIIKPMPTFISFIQLKEVHNLGHFRHGEGIWRRIFDAWGWYLKVAWGGIIGQPFEMPRVQ